MSHYYSESSITDILRQHICSFAEIMDHFLQKFLLRYFLLIFLVLPVVNASLSKRAITVREILWLFYTTLGTSVP